MNNIFSASDIAIFSGSSVLPLAEDIARRMGHHLGKAHISEFNDGEIRIEIGEPVRGKTIFIIQSTCAPVNDNIMELVIMTDALRRSHAKRVIAVVPYYGYSRQDRRPSYSRTPISSRLVADMIEVSGIDYLITVDIHSTQQQGFFKIPFTNISASVEFVADIWRRTRNIDDLVIVSPDVGGVKRARSIAKSLDDAALAIVDKRRPEAGVSEVMNIIGDVDGKDCVIVDDMIDTAGTLCKAATALKNEGAAKVSAYATHAVLSGSAYTNIANSVLDEVVVTNTIPISLMGAPPQIRTINMAAVIAETMTRISLNKSVSEMYIDD